MAKKKHAVALAEGGRTGKVRSVGELRMGLASHARLVRRPRSVVALITRHLVAPLTTLRWPTAVGSSLRSGIDSDSILSCDVLGVYKPASRCYVRCAEIVDRAPHKIVVVASHPSDLRAGMTAGYRAAHVPPCLRVSGGANVIRRPAVGGRPDHLDAGMS